MQQCLRIAQMLLLYQDVLETPAGEAYLQCLKSAENRSAARARYHHAQMLKAMWPTAACWSDYVKLRVRTEKGRL